VAVVLYACQSEYALLSLEKHICASPDVASLADRVNVTVVEEVDKSPLFICTVPVGGVLSIFRVLVFVLSWLRTESVEL